MKVVDLKKMPLLSVPRSLPLPSKANREDDVGARTDSPFECVDCTVAWSLLVVFVEAQVGDSEHKSFAAIRKAELHLLEGYVKLRALLWKEAAKRRFASVKVNCHRLLLLSVQLQGDAEERAEVWPR